MMNRSDEATVNKIKVAIQPMSGDLEPEELLTEEGLTKALQGRGQDYQTSLVDRIYEVRQRLPLF